MVRWGGEMLESWEQNGLDSTLHLIRFFLDIMDESDREVAMAMS